MMYRSVALLGTLACLAVPALADDHKDKHSDRHKTTTDARHDMKREPRTSTLGTMQTLSPYGAHERKMPSRFYRYAYHLTPRDYSRLRAMGFSTDETYMIANAAMETGLDTRVFADAIYRGLYSRQFATEWGISPRTLTRVLPEWRTAEWAAAVNEPVYTREKLSVW